jgi:hypothetical protein
MCNLESDSSNWIPSKPKVWSKFSVEARKDAVVGLCEGLNKNIYTFAAEDSKIIKNTSCNSAAAYVLYKTFDYRRRLQLTGNGNVSGDKPRPIVPVRRIILNRPEQPQILSSSSASDVRSVLGIKSREVWVTVGVS